jgi:hypothetical protein
LNSKKQREGFIELCPTNPGESSFPTIAGGGATILFKGISSTIKLQY